MPAKKKDPRTTCAIKLNAAERRRIDHTAAAMGLNRSQFIRACTWAVLGAARGDKRSSA